MNEIFYQLVHTTMKKEMIAFLVYNTTIRFTAKKGMVLIHWINKNIKKGFFQLSPGNINIIRFIFHSFFLPVGKEHRTN